MKLSQRPTRKARIEIIPMIDTIFFLLVFFMFSSLSMVRMRGMAVAVPRSAARNAESTGQPATNHLVVLTVTGSGDWFVKRQPVTAGSLRGVLSDQLARDPEMAVVLNVAKSQSTQSLVRIMDAVDALRTKSGRPVKALIATVPVDADGRALPSDSEPEATGGRGAR